MTITALTPLLPALSAAELRTHLRNFNTEENSLMESYILAMQQDIETCCERALTVRKFRLTLPCFPTYGTSGAIMLRMVPCARIVTVEYYDSANDLQEHDDWNVITDFEPAEVHRSIDTTWPQTASRRDAVIVTFWAGNLVPVTFQFTDGGDDPDTYTFTNTTGYELSDDDAITLSFSGNTNSVLGDVATLPDGASTNTTYYVVNATATTFQIAATAGGAVIDLADPAASGSAVDKLFVGTIDPWAKLCLMQAAAHAYGQRCPQGGCVCSAEDFESNPMYRRLKWRPPAEFV